MYSNKEVAKQVMASSNSIPVELEMVQSLLPPHRLNLAGDTVNCLYASQGGKFFKVVDVRPEAMTDPVEMEIANAYMMSNVIDPHAVRTPRYIGATRACVAKRAGGLGQSLTPCSTLRNGRKDRVAVVYHDISMRGAGDKIYNVATRQAPGLRDGALRRAGSTIARFCAWFREKSVTYDLRHNDMHSTNVSYDIRARTLKLIDWGRTSIGNYKKAGGDGALAEIRAVMGASNTFDYGQEIANLVSVWPHIRHNMFPKNRDKKYDKPWAPDLTMFLACITSSLFTVWTAYPEVGVQYSVTKRRFYLAERVSDSQMHQRIEATFQSPTANPLYILCLCVAQAIAYELRSHHGGCHDLEFEELTADLTGAQYTSLTVNIERAINLSRTDGTRGARAGGGADVYGQWGGTASDDADVMASLFPTSLSQASALKSERLATKQTKKTSLIRKDGSSETRLTGFRPSEHGLYARRWQWFSLLWCKSWMRVDMHVDCDGGVHCVFRHLRKTRGITPKNTHTHTHLKE